MKYVFFGTPRFAAVVLERLIRAGFTPAALVANPDRPVGRKKIITPPPTKILMTVRGMASPSAASTDPSPLILQPEKLDEAFAAELKALEPDFFVVAAYAKIIPQSILDIPRLGTLGVHPSLLPKYRGASPLQSCILAGESLTGTTIYLMDEKMDHGPIFISEEVALDPLQVTTEKLGEKLAAIGGDLVARLIPGLLDGTAKSVPQNETEATFTKKFSANDGTVDPRDLKAAEDGDTTKAREIVLKVNALGEEPGVWSVYNGARTKILKAELADGKLRLLSLQREGGVPFTPSSK